MALFLSCSVLLLLATGPAQAGEANAPEAFAAGDIQFCPAGKAYGDPSCDAVVATMADAISDAKTAAAAGISGTIYVESGSYSNTTGDSTGGVIYISDFDYGTSLVVQGGVGGGTTTFVRGVDVRNNDLDGLDFTLQDVTINTSNAEHGLILYNSIGEINIQDVTVNAPNLGMYINEHTGDIELDTVTADGNGSTNISINHASAKEVTLNHINASSNGSNSGIYLGDITASKGVVLTGVTADSNTGDNIYAYHITGNVSMSDIQASGCTGSTGITALGITGKLEVENATINTNTSNNISVSDVSGDVILDQVEASGSATGYGLDFTNVRGKKGVVLENVTANSNDDDNIHITSLPSSVSMTEVTANESVTSSGIYVQGVDGSKGVTIKTATANGNFSDNIYINDLEGDAKLSGVTAGGSSNGAGLNVGSISGKRGVSLSSADISTNNSANIRINSITTGNIDLKDVIANGSVGSYGLDIGNVAGSKGVTLKNVTANSNAGDNIYMFLITGNVGMTGVNASTSTAGIGINLDDVQGTKGVTMKDVTANGNNGTNIEVYDVASNASLSSVTANLSSTNYGVYLRLIQGSKGVTLKTVTADGNNDTNFYLYQITGNANLSGMQANSSTAGYGIYLYNLDGTKGASLKSVTASTNEDDNIYVADVEGGASLSSVTANGSNSNNGVYLSDIKGSKGVSLKTVTADDNDSNNVVIGTITGDVKVSNMTANGSTNGVGVRFVTISGGKGVSIKGVTANNNDGTGVEMNAISGNATLSGVTSNSCTGTGCHGVWVHNIDGSKGVNLKSVVADGNVNFNIIIDDVVGDVKLNNVTASNNVSSNGLYIGTVGGARGVDLKKVTALSNYGTNIYIYNIAPGGVVVNGVTANESDTNNGMYIEQVAGTVMVMKSFFNDNEDRGIYAWDNSGLIALKGVEGNNNVNNDGAYLGSSNNLLVCDSQFIGNGLSGTTAYGVFGYASGYSLTIAGTDLGPPNNLTGTAEKSGGTTLWENTSTKCVVIPAP